jgi:chaperone required for assembly of F1-ATPase
MTKPMTETIDAEKLKRLMHDRFERPLAKRFYATVEVAQDLRIALDGRTVKTPLKAELRLPTLEMAEAVAGEWRNQTGVINPADMPLTRLANTAIDRASLQRDQLLQEVVVYANADLVCYRAVEPEALVQQQMLYWDPVLAWALQRCDAMFITTPGINQIDQPPQALEAARKMISTQNDFELTATYNLVTLLGSSLIPLMLADHAISSEHAWTAAHVDEDFQISQWGQDDEAQRRRTNRRKEFDATVAFLRLSK